VLGLADPAIVELRSLADANRIVGIIGGWKHVCVIGGGFIGLEAAGLLATMGVGIDVVEMAPRLMQRAVSPAVSQWFLDFHRSQANRMHMSTQVKAVDHRQGGATVALDSGEAIDCDAVILAAGVMPNAELAAAAGLKVENGIVVDEFLVTSDPAISAIGDCAFYPSRHLPGMARLESVQNATDQGRAVAARIMGEAKPYDALPWFWSIQGEARLQIAGLSKPGLAEVLRGDPASGKFSVFLYEGDRLACVESVNAPGDHMAASRIIAAGTKVDPARAADVSVDMKVLMAG
jgi:3-phenylpropionate/trans-cinnamate dioxygenase ferredoxin reductase subunit